MLFYQFVHMLLLFVISVLGCMCIIWLKGQNKNANVKRLTFLFKHYYLKDTKNLIKNRFEYIYCLMCKLKKQYLYLDFNL